MPNGEASENIRSSAHVHIFLYTLKGFQGSCKLFQIPKWKTCFQVEYILYRNSTLNLWCLQIKKRNELFVVGRGGGGGGVTRNV